MWHVRAGADATYTVTAGARGLGKALACRDIFGIGIESSQFSGVIAQSDSRLSTGASEMRLRDKESGNADDDDQCHQRVAQAGEPKGRPNLCDASLSIRGAVCAAHDTCRQ